MIKLQYLDKSIEERLLKESKESESKHTPSGKLSASKLGQPVQWQILHVIGVPQEEREEYVTRKFLRGNHVEEWLASYMDGIINRQKFVEYRNTVGWVDAIVDMKDWNLDFGVIPHEIKSVSNMKFKRIQKDGADESHILQACLYAKALNTETFALDYVSTDDYRVETYLFNPKDRLNGDSDETIEQRLEKVIDTFDTAIKSKLVPAFVPILKWHSDQKYNSYSRFVDKGPIEIDEILKNEYPESYKILKGENDVS